MSSQQNVVLHERASASAASDSPVPLGRRRDTDRPGTLRDVEPYQVRGAVLPWSPRRMGRSPGVDHARHDTRRAMGDLQAGEPCPALGETRALTGTRRGPALWHRYQQNASRCQPGCSSSVDQRPTAPPIRPTADNRLKVLCRNVIGQPVVVWADTLMAYPLGQQLQ